VIEYLVAFAGFLAGVYSYLKSRLTLKEIRQILDKAKEIKQVYDEAMQDKRTTKSELLEITKQCVELAELIINALESENSE